MIDVILMERVERLGHLGDVVRVRPGFARNFLLPRKKALRATPANIEFFKGKKAEIESQNLKQKAEAEKVASKMNGLKMVVLRQAGESGQLFGSVTSRDVAADAKTAGFTIDKTQVQIDTPIKAVGLYKVKVRLHPEVSVTVTLNVARTAEEAEVQEKTGHAVAKKAADLSAEALAQADAVDEEAAEA